METGIAIIDDLVAPSYLKEIRGEFPHIERIASARKAHNIQSGVTIEINQSDEKTSLASTPEEQSLIVIIPIDGMIRRQDVMGKDSDRISYWGMSSVSRMIDYCIENEKVKAIIFDVESGGGFSNANSSVIDSINRFNATGRFTYASVDTACSAAYHMIVFVNGGIFAKSKMSILGCMGTVWKSEIITSPNYKEIEVYSDLSPQKNQEFNLALKGKPEILRTNLLNPMARAMIDDVLSRRKINQDAIEGASVAAEKGINVGLCDAIMPLSELIQKIASGEISSAIPAPVESQKANSNPKNTVMSKLSIMGWTIQVKAGKTTPEQDEEAINELQRLTNIESSAKESIRALTQERDEFKEKVTSLSVVETENVELKNQVQSYKNQLEKITGEAPKQPNSTAEKTQTTEAKLDDNTKVASPLSKDFYSAFDAQVKSKAQTIQSNFNF